MITIGVQTKGILPCVNTARAFDMIRAAGFDCIDFNLDSFLRNNDLYSGRVNSFFDFSREELRLFFGEYKAQMDRVGLKASQMHAPYPIWVDLKWEQNDYVMGDVIPKSLEIAHVMDIPWVVIHPMKMQKMYGKAEELRQNVEYYKSLVPLLKEYKVGVCVEDLYESVGGRITEGPCTDADEAIYYIDTLNDYAGEELFGLCLDTGHLQLTKQDPAAYIRRAGSRIKVLHLHENDSRYDLHQMPFTYGRKAEDGLNWQEIAHALAEAGYDGTLSFETFPCIKAFPKEILPAALRTMHEIGEYIKSEIETEILI